jgi:hypothetical protein
MKRPSLVRARLKPKIVALLLVLGCILASPWFAQWVLHGYLERTASALNGAEVSIGDFHFSLFQGRAVLQNIQVTQHTEPRFNLFEIEELRFSLNRSALFSLKIAIPEMQITGLRLRTERERSGELPADLSTNPTPLIDRVRADPAFLVQGPLKASPLRFVAALSQNRETPLVEEAVRRASSVQKDATAFGEQVQSRTAHWANTLTSLVAPERNPSPYLVQRRIEQLGELKRQVRSDTEQLQHTAQQLRETLPGRIVESLGRSGILNGDESDLSDALFGSRFAGHVERLSYWIEVSRRRIAFGPSLGSLAHSPHEPFISIGEITLIPSAHPRAFSVSGTIKSLTTFPIGKATALLASLKADLGKGEAARLELRVDHTGATPIETLSLRAKELELTNWQIENSPEARFLVASPSAGFTLEAKSVANSLEVEEMLEVKEPLFSTSSRSKPLEKTLVNVTAQNEKPFRIAASLKNQILKVQSSLGVPLAEALRAEFGPAMKARYELAVLDLSTKTGNSLLRGEQALESHSLKIKAQANQGISQWSALKPSLDR